MVYDVYAGGIHAVEAEVIIDTSKPGRYSISMGGHTRGFLGSIAPWNGIFESHGWTGGEGEYQPELHKSTTTWRDETEIKEYKYTKDGGFQELIITDHDKAPRREEVEAELTQGTTDAFSAALASFNAVATDQNCEGSYEVFDGKRRFEQVFVQKDLVDLESSKYNIYEGPAARCTVEVKPVAGEWHKKPRGWMSIQEQGRKKGTMPTVWMAKINDNGPAVPVKVFVKTEFGGLYMHLTEYHNGGQVLLAEKRGDD